MRHAGNGNVVALFDGAASLKYQAIGQVDAYWEALRAGRIMPDRAEVDPRGLGSALEYTFLLEHVAPGIGRVRISGMHLRDILGMEVRGMPLTAFFVPDARDRISRVLESVVTTPQVADISIAGERGIGKPVLPARLLLAPLANSGRGSPRVLACLESRGDIGRAPRRFTIEQVQLRRIVETKRPDAEVSAKTAEPVEFAEPKPESYVTPQPSERPYLRLVRTDG
ncbi:PAS domain-containing protein [Pseudoruegeria sp. HB172150]|uniref:PAS domain-containing protein n=1 Tax=Pseudoruegeria sp. HB172150 TaxID=2721164 RepID=UPI0015574699|nr:PAS domain-containing protein [Pseudoruegeria sp. HB172150]